MTKQLRATTARRSTSVIAAFICGTFALLVGVAMLSLSARIARMAAPLGYDDVVYVLSGYELYELWLGNDKIEALGFLLQAHAPITTALATLALLVFGLHEWSVYAMNVGLLVALAAAVFWIGRPLGFLPRIAITIVVVCTPVASNLVTEFRPDLMWGFLCGFAVYLIFDPRFLRGSLAYQVLAVIATAMALLGKPSAFFASTVLLAYASMASLLLSLREQDAASKGTHVSWKRLAIFVGAVALFISPYYLQNIGALRHYLYLAYVDQADLQYGPQALWEKLIFYSFGGTYNISLSLTLWLGLFVLLLNAFLFIRSGNTSGLFRYLAYAAAVFAAYCAPTLNPFRSFYIGGIFYGTFIFFTVHGLVLILRNLEARSPISANLASAPLLIFGFCVFQPNPLAFQHGASQATYLTNVNEKVVAALIDSISKMPQSRTPVIYLPQTYPVQAEYIQLRARWAGLNIIPAPGYYEKTLEGQKDLLQRSDLVVLTDPTPSKMYHGNRLAPQMQKIVVSDPDFVQVVEFSAPWGDRMTTTRLFARRDKD